MPPVNVFARWRPLAESTNAYGEISRSAHRHSGSLFSVSVSKQTSEEKRHWTSSAAFSNIFEPEDDNCAVYMAVVAPVIPRILVGENCAFFAYGHSGSGKTHTILGYDFKDDRQLGVCLLHFISRSRASGALLYGNIKRRFALLHYRKGRKDTK